MHYWDVSSLIIYLLAGCIFAYLMSNGTKLADKTKISINKSQRVTCDNRRWNLFFFIAFLIFVFLAVGRKVDEYCGGADAIVYVNDFVKGDFTRYSKTDILFGLFSSFIRFFTNNYRIYFFIIYSIIVFSYCYVIKTFCPNYCSFIPLICSIFPFIRSFNTMRSSLAIAVFAIGLCFLKKKKKRYIFLSIILAITSCFIHRMLILHLPSILFYYVYKKIGYKINKGKQVIVSILMIVITVAVSIFLRNYIIKFGIFDNDSTADSSYVQASLGTSIISSYPMYFAHMCLLVVIWFLDNKVRRDDNYLMVKAFCLYDIIIIIPSVVLGIWRANEVLYIFRLIMWGYLVDAEAKLFTTKDNSRLIFRIAVFIVVLGWLIFRIWRTWEKSNLMPYIFDLFS
ncbi:MAG: EpsG family protein [Bacilli bacterium]